METDKETYEVYFSDLKEEIQEEILKFWNTTRAEENTDIVILAILEKRENGN